MSPHPALLLPPLRGPPVTQGGDGSVAHRVAVGRTQNPSKIKTVAVLRLHGGEAASHWLT
jgi:hypothetical protein